MSVLSRRKETGEVFNATNEWIPDDLLGRDAHELEAGKSYAGHLFINTNVSPDATSAEFERVEWAIFKAEELEHLRLPFRLRRRRAAVA